jgi:hypothetical protein
LATPLKTLPLGPGSDCDDCDVGDGFLKIKKNKKKISVDGGGIAHTTVPHTNKQTSDAHTNKPTTKQENKTNTLTL